ncbi:MAG: DUF547 domain-containing protein, partial [Bdellovibrionota bacterium]
MAGKPGGLKTLRGNLEAALDMARKARSGAELVKAFLPAALVPPIVLNGGPAPAGAPLGRDAAKELRKICNELRTVVTEDGKADYAALPKSEAYARLQERSRILEGAKPAGFSDSEKLAFWINLYNVLTLHGVIALGIQQSVMEVPSFFRRVAYRVGGEVLTLDGMEHGVLRKNASHPAGGRCLFSEGDPRLAFCPSVLDPRLHMALVCASKSCPPISFYDSDRIDAQLTLATENFIANHVRADPAAREIHLSQIFRWYEADF